MQKTCRQCAQQFEITDEDLKFYEDTSPVLDGNALTIPAPTLCPDCRQQRRLSFRNERKLYQRKCNLCGVSMISMYSPDKPLTVYCSNCWWSDKWDSSDYGKEFDFKKPFFAQFQDLMQKVPLLSNAVWNSVNCEYNSYCVDSKNCYMSSRVVGENLLYSYLPLHSLNCMDCYTVTNCQYCYECVDCYNCYNAYFCQQCKNTSDSAFCYDCIGCKNCFGCVGLRNAEYHIFNKKYSKEEYKKIMAQYNLGSYENLEAIKSKFSEYLLKKPRRGEEILNSENVLGNHIIESKDAINCFDVEKSETVRNSWGVEYSKDVRDCSFIYYGENCYENIANSHGTNIFFSAVTIQNVHNLFYSMMCVNNTHNCFGSISLKQKKYCILNKQYTKEEYEKLVPQIIEHMRKTGEYGEFFPISISPFAYNETVAQEFFPLTAKDARKLGYKWKEKDISNRYLGPLVKIEDSISDVPEDITNQIITCETCEKNYKIIPQELQLYRQMKIAIPRQCMDCRHKARVTMRNPRKLWNRKCAKCSAEIRTSYAPDRPETVYCEACYLKEVY